MKKRYAALLGLVCALCGWALASIVYSERRRLGHLGIGNDALAAQWRTLVESSISIGDTAITISPGGDAGEKGGVGGLDDSDQERIAKFVASASSAQEEQQQPASNAVLATEHPASSNAVHVADSDDWLEGTAIVTMAAGDDAGKLAVALVQSLRDSHTRVPVLEVLLARGGRGSSDCQNETWKAARGRSQVACNGADTIEEEIVSERYLHALKRLGAVTRIVDTIPETPFTNKIPGGRTVFWGMAFNKLHVFNMTQYRKVLWMDSDTLVLRNVDHLLKEPMFTAAYTHACCNPNAPAVPSGGLWVVEPSVEVGLGLWRMMNGPLPGSKEGDGDYERLWMYGDMQLVRYFFGNMTSRGPGTQQPLWPFIEDSSHGVVPGLRYLPAYATVPQDELAAAAVWKAQGPLQGSRLGAGFMPELWDGSRPAWRCLDPRYDQCVGMCECLPGRDIPDLFFSVHFSCLHGLKKPSEFESEAEFGGLMYRYAVSCQRHYFWHKWYSFFQRGFGRLPPPYWEGPEIPGYNSSHDKLVAAWRLERQK